MKLSRKSGTGLVPSSQVRSLKIGYDPTVQQQKSWAVQISKLPGGGQITELRIHICRFDDEKRQCFGLAHAQPSKIRLSPCLILQSLQFTKIPLQAQYFQAKP